MYTIVVTMTDQLSKIKETIGGVPVKDLRWNKYDSIYYGLVKCPIWGKPNLHDGYVAVTWRKDGKLSIKYGGGSRKDLYLNLEMIK